MSALLARQQLFRRQRLSAEVDQAIDSDRRFFRRRPDRSYRVPRAFPAEAHLNALVYGLTSPSALPHGLVVFVAVRQMRGVRLRLLLLEKAGSEPDLFSESKCREIWDLALATVREVDQAFERPLRKRGRQ
jgi:hypothetical protein